MADVEALLRAHPTLTKLPSGKLRDSLTGHEMPARVESIQSYITGSRYKKAREWYSKDYSKYEPFIVASKNSEKRLFCTLTRVELNKIPEEVQAHVGSSRYKAALAAVAEKEERERRRAAGEFVDPSEDEEEEEEEDDGEGMEEEEAEEVEHSSKKQSSSSAGVHVVHAVQGKGKGKGKATPAPAPAPAPPSSASHTGAGAGGKRDRAEAGQARGSNYQGGKKGRA